jgi:hypothetical protein
MADPETPEVQELRLSGSRAEAVAAIREALPNDAVVRGEDDAIGRFASERIVMIVGAQDHGLQLFFGGWRVVASREGQPQLRVEFVDTNDGVTARLTRAAPEKVPLVSRGLGLLNNAATVAILVVAYHLYQKVPIDYMMVAGIGLGGGLVWAGIAHLLPRTQDGGMHEIVRGALGPGSATTSP